MGDGNGTSWERPSSSSPPSVTPHRRRGHRLDRKSLLAYLEHLGIPARTDASYALAILLQERACYQRRGMTLDEARADFR